MSPKQETKEEQLSLWWGKIVDTAKTAIQRGKLSEGTQIIWLLEHKLSSAQITRTFSALFSSDIVNLYEAFLPTLTCTLDDIYMLSTFS